MKASFYVAAVIPETEQVNLSNGRVAEAIASASFIKKLLFFAATPGP